MLVATRSRNSPSKNPPPPNPIHHYIQTLTPPRSREDKHVNTGTCHRHHSNGSTSHEGRRSIEIDTERRDSSQAAEGKLLENLQQGQGGGMVRNEKVFWEGKVQRAWECWGGWWCKIWIGLVAFELMVYYFFTHISRRVLNELGFWRVERSRGLRMYHIVPISNTI